ncbi:MAG: DsbE family thiol:disulfide interchange protein [Gammaproteobacteria bacterium]
MMNRFLLPLGAFALLVVVLYFGVQNSPDHDHLKSVLIGKPAPQFTLPDLMKPGENLSNTKLKGKPYVLNVWATWCATCRVEHPELLELARTQDVPIIGLNWKDDGDLAHEWLDKLGNPYAAIPVDRPGREAINWGVTAAPESFLVDANGVVQFRLQGAMTKEIWDTEFAPRIAGKSMVAR